MILCPICKSKLVSQLPNSTFYVCNKCQLATRAEEDMPQKQNDIYDEQWTLGEEQKYINVKMAHYRLRQIKKMKSVKRISDIGCGTGILVDLLAQNGYIVDGIDTSKANIDYAKKNKRGNYFLQDIESFDAGDKYDLIIASHLIEHLRTPGGFLRKVKNLLKKNGLLYIATPNLSAWSPKSLWRKNLGGICGTDHRILYSFKGLSKLLSMNNFSVICHGTKTRSGRMLEEIVRALYLKSSKAPSARTDYTDFSTPIIKRGPIKTCFLRIMKKIYKFVKNSLITDLLLFIPNKISEVKGRGEELIVIARV